MSQASVTIERLVDRGPTVADLERAYIERVLEDEGGNKTRTAQRLGLDRKTLYRKLDEYARQAGTRPPTDETAG